MSSNEEPPILEGLCEHCKPIVVERLWYVRGMVDDMQKHLAKMNETLVEMERRCDRRVSLSNS